MSEYEFIFDNLRWSFSNLKSFGQCPFEWQLKYIDCERGVENIYGQFGSLCHKILEMYLKGDMKKDEMLPYYMDNFDSSVEYLVGDKYGSRDKLYRIGYVFFENYMFDITDNKIIGVEQKLDFDFNGKTFIGIIDLSYKDKDGNIIILDHKTAESPFGKSGSVKKTKEKDLLFYKRQLYLYCYGFYKQFGRMPKKIGWNFIRDNKTVLLDVKKEEYDEAVQWATDTIRKIYETDSFKKVDNYFYCNNLCQYRNICYKMTED
ncbi:hypothetical protein RASY3_14825 [Ruminococcus albus SY3]|uniref:PD-(D/E)XK endonuclease-like domain-containing protein n=1 Tax=Ruminococcus albus SY3 TaxID=1341156 RepID=A0A011VVH9_RUMAL|nr:PD-(D/E)XK nuclease family protein [Ruminococcus albus]EXM38578.1 hypothetical protein RASY3_14825 [Ruminococcus albus SY3]